ncbi:MAG: SIS domain-containing protein [Ferruginibacter sp.]
MQDFIKKYLLLHQETLDRLPQGKLADIINLFKQALDNDRQVFVFGNGGSAANASHFVTDLGKGSSDKTYKRFRCLSLNDNTNWMTAISNDYSYDEVYVRQLMNLARPGDIVFVMSVSGNSPNLVTALEWSAQNDIHSIALVGNKKGRLAELADTVLIVTDEHYGRVEDAHMTVCHIIAYAFMEITELQQP